MYPQKCTTAEQASQKFVQLMKSRPNYWAENVNDAISDLTDEFEQLQFLGWMADPQGKTNNREKVLETRDCTNRSCFENDPNFEVTNFRSGKLPCVSVLYKPDDEKQ